MGKYSFTGENPFNICAEEICRLRELDRELFNFPDIKRTEIPPENLKEAVDTLFEQLPVMSESTALLRKGVPEEELKILHEWKYYGQFAYMREFLSRYTQQLSFEEILHSSYLFSLTHCEDGVVTEFECLNDNQEKTKILILPRVPTINDPLDPAREDDLPEKEITQKHWATNRLPGIQNDLSNVFYVEMDKFETRSGSYSVGNVVLERDFFPAGKKRLRIAVCPVAHKDLVKVTTYAKTEREVRRKFFSADGLKDATFVHNKVKAAFLQAAELSPDVIIFPEMLGDANILSEKFFHEVMAELSDLGCYMPSLVLAPTWWHDGRNELYVFDGSGRRLCIQQKQYPYFYEEGGLSYTEDLKDPERIIHLVHIPACGRIAFPICRDFLEEDYIRLMLEQLRTTFLLCPAFSPHKTQFELVAPSANKYGCYSICCNTCAAFCENEIPPSHVGLIAGPQSETNEVMKYLTPKCEGVCGDQNKGCVFLAEIDMDHSGNISCSHISHTPKI